LRPHVVQERFECFTYLGCEANQSGEYINSTLPVSINSAEEMALDSVRLNTPESERIEILRTKAP